MITVIYSYSFPALATPVRAVRDNLYHLKGEKEYMAQIAVSYSE